MNGTLSRNEISARSHLLASEIFGIIGNQEGAEYEREYAYQSAHSAGMDNEVVSSYFKNDQFLAKAYRDGVEDAKIIFDTNRLLSNLDARNYSALNSLLKLIESGLSVSDAVRKASYTSGVSCEALSAIYNQYCGI